MASLAEATMQHGRVHNTSFLVEAVVGDLLRIVRDLRKGDIQKARSHLELLSSVELDEFFESTRVDPTLTGQLQRAFKHEKEPEKLLAMVFNVLFACDAVKLHGGLHPPPR